MGWTPPPDQVEDVKTGGWTPPPDQVEEVPQEETTKQKVSRYARPSLELAGGLLGGAAGTALGGGVGSIPAAAIGGALGFSGGKATADLLDRFLGVKEPIQSGLEAIKETGEDLKRGVEVEGTGRIVGAVAKPVIEHVVQPVLEGIGDVAGTVGKKALSAFLGPSEEAIEARIADPEAIIHAPHTYELAERLPDTLHNLKNQIGEYDSAAWDTLGFSHDPAEGAIPKESLIDNINKIQNQYKITGGGIAGEADAKAVSKLDAIKQRIMELGSNVRGYLESEQGVPSSLKNKDYISERGLKEIIQSYDKDINYNDASANAANEAISNVRQMVDGILKTNNPDYARQMAPVSDRVKLLNDLERRLNIIKMEAQNATTANLERALNEKTIATRANLEKLKEFTGEDYLKDVQNAKYASEFEGGKTNGSRRVNLFGTMGAAVGGGLGKMFGQPVGGGTLGATLGAQAGSYIDQEGGKIAGNLIDFYVKHRPQDLGRFAPILQQAAERGAQSLAITHNLLQQRDPEYQNKIKELQGSRENQGYQSNADSQIASAPDSAFRRGMVSMMSGDYQDAINEWMKVDPSDPDYENAKRGVQRLTDKIRMAAVKG